VLNGHVDSLTGPAVFFRLRALRVGDEVVVALSDGRSVRFLVDRVEEYDKAAFPTQAVYGPTTDPVLRLVTCGGLFDRESGHYIENVVVFASRAAA
jgi:sortase (surface protein transpeptidase)